MKWLAKILMAFALVANLILLTGCIYPHTTPRSNAADGRVLDAKTHAPVQHAEISLNQSPHHATYTDKNGYFHLKATRNFILLGIAPDGVWPDEKDDIMKISHPKYETVWGTWGTNAGDIFLQPKQ
jgi:hypothetical protein